MEAPKLRQTNKSFVLFVKEVHVIQADPKLPILSIPPQHCFKRHMPLHLTRRDIFKSLHFTQRMERLRDSKRSHKKQRVEAGRWGWTWRRHRVRGSSAGNGLVFLTCFFATATK